MLLTKGPHTKRTRDKQDEKNRRKYINQMEMQHFSTFLTELWKVQGQVSYQSALAFDIYEQVINHDVLTELLAQQSNLCFQKNGRNFLNNTQEIKGFIDVNYIMAVNQLSNIPMYWDHNYFVGKVEIQNIFMRTRYQEVLQKPSFCQ